MACAGSLLANVTVGGSTSGNASPNALEAFTWNEADGMVGLGDLPGGAFDSIANCVSHDGAIVVGNGTTDLGSEAFIWDADNGMRNVRQVLVDDYGLDLTGWTLTYAWGVSGDGQIIVGSGINPEGFEEGWIATIPRQGVPVPAAYESGFAVMVLLFTAAGAVVLGRRSRRMRTVTQSAI